MQQSSTAAFDSKRELTYQLLRKMQDAVNAFIHSPAAQSMTMLQLQKQCNDLAPIKLYREHTNYDAASRYQVAAALGTAIKAWVEGNAFEGARA